jgi:hypothetical protein
MLALMPHTPRFDLPFIVLALLLTGCPICPDGELLVIEGSQNIGPNQSVQFVFRYGDETYSSPAKCGGHWYVNDIEGGGETIGTITPCGRYTAPITPPPKAVLITAAEYPPGTCADCCPYASISVMVNSN